MPRNVLFVTQNKLAQISNVVKTGAAGKWVRMLAATLMQRMTAIIRGGIDRETGGEEPQLKWSCTGDTIAP
ncbi:hypothetical protein N7454_000543 [Penicillium verhagenii]|nr:hypothetical protein N7454_000543 [Penicillium verhagenii]